MWSKSQYLAFEDKLNEQAARYKRDLIDGTTNALKWSLENCINERWLKDHNTYINLIPIYGVPQPTTVTKYFITFTRNPNTQYSVADWRAAVHSQLDRKWFVESIAVFEHEDTNIHCHALITPQAGQRVHKDQFTMFVRKYGNIDIKCVKKDNGILDYMSKENKIFIKRSPPKELSPEWPVQSPQ